MSKLKELFKKRVVILAIIFVFLLFIYGIMLWLKAPFKVVNCIKGQYVYAHTSPFSCSNKAIYSTDSIVLNDLLGEIVYQSGKTKVYARNNIADYITLGREYNYFGSNNYSYYSINWLLVLLKIGHYNEVEKYINSPDFEKINILEEKERCYNSYNNFTFISCLINSKQNDFNFKTKELWLQHIKNHINDTFKIPKFNDPSETNVSLASEAMHKEQLDLAYKYLCIYASHENHSNHYTMSIYFKLGLAYMDKQNYKKAIECFNKILEIQDYNYKAHEKLEICYKKLGNTKKAREHEQIMKELLAL